MRAVLLVVLLQGSIVVSGFWKSEKEKILHPEKCFHHSDCFTRWCKGATLSKKGICTKKLGDMESCTERFECQSSKCVCLSCGGKNSHPCNYDHDCDSGYCFGGTGRDDCAGR